jgi:hypothetical protein
MVTTGRSLDRWRLCPPAASRRAAKLIQDALGIKSDDVVNYTSPRFAAIHR